MVSLPFESNPPTDPSGQPAADIAEARFQSVPLEVFIVTRDHELQGVVHVPRGARPDRRLTELLNNPDKRFLAVTDVEMLSRVQVPATPMHYDFIELHVDSIQMLHPSTQSVVRNQPMAEWQTRKLSQLRHRLSQ